MNIEAPVSPTVSHISTHEIKALLRRFIEHPGAHRRWLNTLSFLEYTGTRKISRSLEHRAIDEEALRHLAEEARHAHFFKRMIERVPGDPACDGYGVDELLGGRAASRYFQSLDAVVRRELVSAAYRREELPAESLSELSYVYVTLLIEERAGLLYPLYDQCLRDADVPVRLSGIVLEEEKHLEDMFATIAKQDPGRDDRLARLREREAVLFARFFAVLKEAV